MLTREELSDEDVMVYYDVVQSVASTKLITAYDEEKAKVGVEVIAYTDDDSKGQMWIYEIQKKETKYQNCSLMSLMIYSLLLKHL